MKLKSVGEHQVEGTHLYPGQSLQRGPSLNLAEALGQVRRPPCPQVCHNLFLLLWPGYKVAQGSDIHVNISPALTEHYQEHVFKNQDSLLPLSFSGVRQKCMQTVIVRCFGLKISWYSRGKLNWCAITRHFHIMMSRCPNVPWSVGHRSHLPGGHYSCVSLTTGGVPMTQEFTTTTRFLGLRSFAFLQLLHPAALEEILVQCTSRDG